ncbi:MAG: Bax inhibitor-1/YccA family protein [Cetobacterium sp.]|uniref:Bax inhibitor-1/YccA family protein n=1 Tax=unclassified Cetobacterium TaxID=2630983 RepID=UPI00163B6ED9|nr:Bax inhibitor-1/YccA family protein [Cetobacterium sp. 2A]MBC2856660.1 Bax inhibitor-1/YccA family protein [Cetobacterium sp. 2A]
MGNTYMNVSVTNDLLRKTFVYMFIGLLITAGVPAYIILTKNTSLLNMIQTYYWPLIIAEFVVVLVLSFAINKISVGMAKILFFAYAFLNGFVFSIFTLFFSIYILTYALGITSLMFLVIAIYGYTTNEDLGKYSKIMFGGLITLVILSVINIFIKAPVFYWLVSVFGVIIFSAMIAFDVNRIKAMAYELSGGNESDIEKMGVIGALSLYLDFVNLFVYILRLVGGGNNKD